MSEQSCGFLDLSMSVVSAEADVLGSRSVFRVLGMAFSVACVSVCVSSPLTLRS